MDKKIFIKILSYVLLSNSFIKKGKLFYKESDEVICQIVTQKSNYSNGYYINIGFILKSINDKDSILDVYNSHIILRFIYKKNNKTTDLFELDSLKENELISILNKNIKEKIEMFMSVNSIKQQLEKEPILKKVILYKEVKELLGIE